MTPADLVAESCANRSRSAEVALLGVYEISKVLTAPAALHEALAKVANLLSSFLDMDHGLIALLNEDGSAELVVGSHCDRATAQREFGRIPEQVIGRIVVTQMPLVIENVKEEPLFADAASFAADSKRDHCLSFVGVPIKDRGRVIGTLSIDREWRPDERREFRLDDDVRFLTMVGNLLGQTVRLQHMLARDRERLLEDRNRLEKALGSAAPPRPANTCIAGIVGASPALRAVLEKIRVVARSHTTVLLRGESGTGKELFARALHDLSQRKDHPFITLNCAALSESVLESELFGHEKGAFTGATSQRKGRFELADQGTLFLDEIGEISLAFQAKLLRVLQLGEFERVGGNQTLKVDVRLVAATNRNLEQAVAREEFRSDLYYRISVVPIVLPPLRERTSDIPLLAREFLERFNRENGTSLQLTDAAIAVLTACYFPGNVRELENCVRRTATLAHDTAIVASDFACRNDECMSAMLWKQQSGGGTFVPLPLTHAAPRHLGSAPAPAPAPTSTTPPMPPPATESPEGERERLIHVMETVGWVQANAARVLGLTPRQIGYALRKHKITIKKFEREPIPTRDALVRVAAAADLSLAFAELGREFERVSGYNVMFSFGSTGRLAQQLREGAHFDVFAAAHVAFVDEMVAAGACDGTTQQPYARGRIAIWSRHGALPPPRSIEELANKRFRCIAIADPENAPYGRAAREALQSAGVWGAVEPRLIYGENVVQTLQLASSGKAEAAIVALSLVSQDRDNPWSLVDEHRHRPLVQTLCLCHGSANSAGALAFARLVVSQPGRALMRRHGFSLPEEVVAALR